MTQHAELAVSVVIPVLNEADNILGLLDEVHSALAPAYAYEVIVVDDESTDQTPQLLHQKMRSLPTLRVLQHGKRCGQSTSIRDGVLAARGELIATLDGDGQNPPENLPSMIQRLHDGGESLGMVAGWRNQRQDSGYKNFQSKVANSVRRRILRDATPDSGCGIKVLRRHLFLRLPYFDHMHRFMPALVRRAGFDVVSQPVNHRPRTGGQSKYGMLDRAIAGAIDLIGVAWLNHRAKTTTTTEITS